MPKENLIGTAENASVGLGEHERQPVDARPRRYSFFAPDEGMPENYEGRHQSSSSADDYPDLDGN